MKKIVIIISIFFILFIISFWLFLSPYQKQIGANKKNINQARSELKKFQQLEKKSQEYKNKFLSLQENIKQLISYLPAHEELNDLAQEMLSMAKKFELKPLKVTLDQPLSIEKIQENNSMYYLEIVPLIIRLEGKFSQIYQYLEKLEKLPFFHTIDALEIFNKSKNNSSTPLIQANIALSVFSVLRRIEPFLSPSILSRQITTISNALITAQKNLQIRDWGKTLFALEEDSLKHNYQVNDREWNSDDGAVPLIDLNLNGILSYQGKYIALINNQRVTTGSMIAGMKVKWISKDRVSLARNNEKVILTLN